MTKNVERKFREQHLVVASHNAGKNKEISALLLPFGVQVTTSASLGLREPEETGTTYFDNALLKARACLLATGLPALGDDSGIEVKALAGEPGLHTAPYTKGHGGREEVFKLWSGLPEIRANSKATFTCVQVLLWPDGHYERFEGIVDGNLCFPPRGEGGHGYDPIFIPEGYHRTLAEMTPGEKNACSHRFIAVQKLISSCFR